MKLISHRGNTFGPNPLKENSPEYIDDAIEKGFDVEIDLWGIDQFFYLGHDNPQYKISALWLYKRNKNIWIHCKNYKALEVISNSSVNCNYFWHENDKFTLTNSGYIWTYPRQEYGFKSIVVMPELNDLPLFHKDDNMIDISDYRCYGICSDYVGRMK